MPDLHEIAELYLQAVNMGFRFGGVGKIAPIKYISLRKKVSSNTASYWVALARKDGLLPPVNKGSVMTTYAQLLSKELNISPDDLESALKKLNIRLDRR